MVEFLMIVIMIVIYLMRLGNMKYNIWWKYKRSIGVNNNDDNNIGDESNVN